MSYYERIIELITEANADSRKRSYEIAKKHGLLGRGDNEFVDLPSGRQGVRNPGRRGKPGTGEGGREQYVTDDDGEYYPYRPEENAPRRKKRRVKESVESVSEANFKRSQRQARSKNKDVARKGAKGIIKSVEQQALRNKEISPEELRMSQEEPNLRKKRLMRTAVHFAADRARRDTRGRLKSLRQFDKKPNE